MPDKPIKDWLEPVGPKDWNLYQSPTKAVDPWDCEKWPDSPYCGGKVLNKDWLGLDPSFSKNKCETCITITPTFIKFGLPPYTICKRSSDPACQAPEPTGPTTGRQLNKLPKGSPVPNRCSDGQKFTLVLYQSNVSFNWWLAKGQDWKWRVSYRNLEALLTYTPYKYGYFERGNIYDENFFSNANQIENGPGYCIVLVYLTAYFGNLSHDSATGQIQFNGDNIRSKTCVARVRFRRQYQDINYYGYGDDGTVVSIPAFPVVAPAFDVRSTVDFAGWDLSPCPQGDNYEPPPQRDTEEEPPDDGMCCKETTELLRLIAKRLGTDQFPAKVPTTLFDSKDDDKGKSIESLTELTGWFIEQVDGLVGQWPSTIEVKDIDPTTQGDQTRKFVYPNISEALTEVLTMSIKQSVDADVTIEFLMRMVSELLSMKNLEVSNESYLKAISDFLGFRFNFRPIEVRYAFDPENLDSLQGIFNDATKYVQGISAEEKESALGYLQKAAFAAGIIKAVHFRSLKDIGKITGQFGFKDGKGVDADKEFIQWIRDVNNPQSPANKDQPTPNVDKITPPPNSTP